MAKPVRNQRTHMVERQGFGLTGRSTGAARQVLSTRMGNVSMRSAAATGDTAKLARLLNAVTATSDSLQVKSVDEEGNSALMLAAHSGHAQCIDLLCAAGADTNQSRETDNKTSLVFATIAGHAECTRRLISAGASTECTTNLDNTAAMLAAFWGRAEILHMLLAAGAATDVRNTPHLRTPMHYAASGGHLDCVRLLVDAGADCTAVSSAGWTPAHEAAARGHSACLWSLLTAAPDTASALNCDGLTPADVAQEQGHNTCMEMAAEYALGRAVEQPSAEQESTPELEEQEQDASAGSAAELDESAAGLEREASVELPTRPAPMEGYQRATPRRQPPHQQAAVALQRPTSAPAVRGSRGGRPASAPAVRGSRGGPVAARRTGQRPVGLSKSFVLASMDRDDAIASSQRRLAAPPATKAAVKSFVGCHRLALRPASGPRRGKPPAPHPPGNSQRRPHTAPSARARPSSSGSTTLSSASPSHGRTLTHKRVAGSQSSEGQRQQCGCHGHGYAARIDTLFDKTSLSARRQRVQLLTSWHRQRHQFSHGNQPGGKAGWHLIRGQAQDHAQVESQCGKVLNDDGSVDKGSDIWSLLNREIAELEDLEEQMLTRQDDGNGDDDNLHENDAVGAVDDADDVSYADPSGGAGSAGGGEERFLVPGDSDLESGDSFMEPGKVVSAGRATWGRSKRISTSSGRRYPYASVDAWMHTLGGASSDRT